MKSYREKFQENLDKEISTFRERTLAQQAQEIYDDVYRIHFYEFMYDYLSSEEFTAKQYKDFLTAENKFINRLWNKALDCEEFNVGNSDDALFLVDEYMRDYAAHPVPKLTFHNLCYKLHIKPENTRSADLDYCGDTRLAVWFPSKILAVLGF